MDNERKDCIQNSIEFESELKELSDEIPGECLNREDNRDTDVEWEHQQAELRKEVVPNSFLDRLLKSNPNNNLFRGEDGEVRVVVPD